MSEGRPEGHQIQRTWTSGCFKMLACMLIRGFGEPASLAQAMRVVVVTSDTVSKGGGPPLPPIPVSEEMPCRLFCGRTCPPLSGRIISSCRHQSTLPALSAAVWALPAIRTQSLLHTPWACLHLSMQAPSVPDAFVHASPSVLLPLSLRLQHTSGVSQAQ